jgi:predicted RND superfamily exporter protein
MNPSIWGPRAWFFLHSVTLNYPLYPSESDKTNYRDFFESIAHILPCDKCKHHYKENLVKYPIQLGTRDQLIQWMIDIHNDVNIQNNKPVWSFEQVMDKYKNIYGDKLHLEKENSYHMKNNNMTIITIILLVIIIFIIIYRLKK